MYIERHFIPKEQVVKIDIDQILLNSLNRFMFNFFHGKAPIITEEKLKEYLDSEMNGSDEAAPYSSAVLIYFDAKLWKLYEDIKDTPEYHDVVELEGDITNGSNKDSN